jgi:dihydropteroate synthase
MFKTLLGLEVHERLVPSVLVAAEMARRGTNIVRVHDVRETRDAFTLITRIS